MKLSPQQLKEFDALGYVFMPGCFAEEEVATLRPARSPRPSQSCRAAIAANPSPERRPLQKAVADHREG